MTPATDPLQDASDEDLLALYARGDRLAARVLTDRLVPRVLAYATRLLAGDRAEAEDVAQEALLRLWRLAPDWRAGEAKVTTWLYRVVTNLCTDRQRSGRRRAAPMGDDLPDAVDSAPGAEAQMQDAARLAALDRALADLPDRQREAAILGVGVEAVESLTARGKRALSAALQGQRAALGYAEG